MSKKIKDGWYIAAASGGFDVSCVAFLGRQNPQAHRRRNENAEEVQPCRGQVLYHIGWSGSTGNIFLECLDKEVLQGIVSEDAR